jgi:hypothetical protein
VRRGSHPNPQHALRILPITFLFGHDRYTRSIPLLLELISCPTQTSLFPYLDSTPHQHHAGFSSQHGAPQHRCVLSRHSRPGRRLAIIIKQFSSARRLRGVRFLCGQQRFAVLHRGSYIPRHGSLGRDLSLSREPSPRRSPYWYIFEAQQPTRPVELHVRVQEMGPKQCRLTLAPAIMHELEQALFHH